MARFNGGWIKIYREMIHGDIGQDPFVLGTFIKLLIWANWRESNTRLAGQRVKLQPGQIVTGLRELSSDIEIDPYLHRVRTALKYLEKRGTITQTTSNQGRVITICNWSEYQCQSDEDSKQGANDAQTTRKQGANDAQHIEEDKKLRREEGKKERLHPLAEIWNQNRESLPQVLGCNKTRLSAAKARWEERPDPEYWATIVRRLAASPFCKGGGKDGWRATFDFLIQPDTQFKAMEGKYDDRAPRGPNGASPPDAEELAERRELARLRAQAMGNAP